MSVYCTAGVLSVYTVIATVDTICSELKMMLYGLATELRQLAIQVAPALAMPVQAQLARTLQPFWMRVA
jgi:hypothetical protein